MPDSPYFTAAELRTKYAEITVPLYADGVVNEAIALAEDVLEEACDVAFTPRTATVVVSTDVAGRLVLPKNRVTSVTSVTGATTGAITLTDLRIVGGSYLVLPASWPVDENLTVVLTHGYATVPRRVKRAAKLLARQELIRGPVDDRATQLSVGDGGVINLSTPGVRGANTGIPEVDATIQQYKRVALVL